MSPRRVFIDVGAHEGQTLEEIVKPEYGFDLIVAFEPMPAQYDVLVKRFGALPNVTLMNSGLADFSGRRWLYGRNDRMEASIWPNKTDVDPEVATNCRFERASEIVARFVADGDEAILKLNCEGAEVPILDDLIASKEIWKIHHVLIDFDIRRVAGQEHEARRVLNDLAAIKFTRYSLSQDVMVGDTHQQRTAAWLATVRRKP